MKGRLRLGLQAIIAVCLAVIPLQPQNLLAQEASARFRVLVPNVLGQQGADKKFGERFASELRDLINDMATHQPIDEKELRNALKQFNLKAENLDCLRTRQLGAQISAQLMFCGTYEKSGEGFEVSGEFWTPTSESFVVAPIQVPEKGQKEAAQHFYEALQVQSEQVRFAQFCGDYASSQLWEQALTNCDSAIELNPNASSSRFTRAMALRNLERREEALEEFKRVLELDQLNEDAMQNAGYLSAQLGNEDDARSYYRQYLELNPTNAAVRMSVAYDLAQAGDPLGAMQFIETGLEHDPENVDLLKQHGGFAMTAGAKLAEGQDPIPAEAAELYRKALSSLQKAYSIQGAETEVTYLRSMVAAHINLQEYAEAAELAGRFLQTHGEEAALWSLYADALQRTGRVEEAVTALDRVSALDPEYPNVAVRKGKWLLDDGQVEQAVPAFQTAVQRGEQPVDQVASLIFANAYEKGVQPKSWDHAVQMLRQAKTFQVSDIMRQQLDFWLAYSIFNKAVVAQEPQTLQTANATLPQFQEALRLIQGCQGYAQNNNLEGNRQQIISATGTYIEIQEAIIKRGK